MHNFRADIDSEVFKVKEFGKPIYFAVGENIASNTNQIVLRKPDGTEITKAATTGTSQYSSPTKGLMAANTYVTYTPVKDEIDVPGTWHVRVTSESGTTYLKKTEWQQLIVKP